MDVHEGNSVFVFGKTGIGVVGAKYLKKQARDIKWCLLPTYLPPFYSLVNFGIVHSHTLFSRNAREENLDLRDRANTMKIFGLSFVVVTLGTLATLASSSPTTRAPTCVLPCPSGYVCVADPTPRCAKPQG